MSKAERAPRLRSANLNLIPVLRALLREASVTRAAATLGLSPSATSCALGDLRRLMNDPLLVPAGRAMRLTPRAEGLIGRLEHACVALEDLLTEPIFDPARSNRRFIVAAPDYISLLVGAELVRRLAQSAPGMRVRFVDVAGDLERQLETGTVDLGFVAVNLLDWKGISTGSRRRDHLVGLVDAAHPLASVGAATAADLGPYAKVDGSPGPSLSERAALAHVFGSPYREGAALVSQWYALLPMIILGTQLVAMVPGALASRMERMLPLRRLELPGPPFVIETSALWSRLQDADPAHAWFRALAQEAMEAVHA